MKIYVSTPTHGWDVSGIYMATMQGLADECRRREWTLYQKPWFGVSDLIKARNVDVHKCLKTDATKFFTFDADQGAEIETLIKIIDSPYKVCAAPVPKKCSDLSIHEQWNFIVEPGHDPVIEGDYMRVACVGAGAMCIDRDVLIEMCYHYGYAMVENEPVPELYDRDWVIDDPLFPMRFSEDYSFCLRARKCGFKPWIYVPGQVMHLGSKVFQGSMHT